MTLKIQHPLNPWIEIFSYIFGSIKKEYKDEVFHSFQDFMTHLKVVIANDIETAIPFKNQRAYTIHQMINVSKQFDYFLPENFNRYWLGDSLKLIHSAIHWGMPQSRCSMFPSGFESQSTWNLYARRRKSVNNAGSWSRLSAIIFNGCKIRSHD